jgi:iron-sulfur cluster repair protein YtfE (RIC family)
MGNDIAGEHENLLQLLHQFHRLVAAREMDRPQLTLRVEALASVVEAHFRHEEAEEGFFADVLAEAPRLEPKIDLLRQQHAGFRAALARLRALAQGNRPTRASWEAVERCFEEFLSQFLAHEGLEDALLQEAYGQDLGDAE